MMKKHRVKQKRDQGQDTPKGLLPSAQFYLLVPNNATLWGQNQWKTFHTQIITVYQ